MRREARIMTKQNAVLKKPTNVSIRSDLLADARELKINLSQEFENHLAEVVRRHRAEQWKVENREAIKAYNRFVEENGIWSDEFRTW
jgi:antitoxin CcdA